MKRTLLSLLAASSLAVALPAVANAQNWMTIDQRQANLDQRIDVGLRQGDLTRVEADRLRADFNALARLEADYRASAPGLTPAETQDLDRRFDALSQRIRSERTDTDRRGDASWMSVNQRQANLYERIDSGVRQGDLTRVEADRLRADFNALAHLEADYRASAPGLTSSETQDLDRRFDALSQRIRFDRHDGDRRDNRGGDHAWNNIQERRAQLDMRIDRALADHRMTWREARDLKRQTAGLIRLEAQYRASRPGLTGMERADLDRRADTIATRIHDEARSYGQGYGNGQSNDYGYQRR